MVLGEMSGGLSDRALRLASFFSEAGVTAEASDNVQRAIWMKFIFICGLSGMTALTRKPIGEIFAQESSTEMYLQVLEEVTAIGRAEGVDLPPDTASKILKSTQAREPFIIGSMGHDLIAGNPIEIGLLNGRVVELGKKHGVPTPANFAITAALMPHEKGRAG